MSEKKGRRDYVKYLAAGVVGAVVGGGATAAYQLSMPKPKPEVTAKPAKPEIPIVKVRFIGLPYGDHTNFKIGVEKGFYKDVGIELDHQMMMDVNKSVSSVMAGGADVGSLGIIHCMPFLPDQPNWREFIITDYFMGFAIMAQKNYKSYLEFRNEGMTPEQAIKATMEQIRGKVIAYLAEAHIASFVETSLRLAGMTLDDVEVVNVDEAGTVAMMISGEAQFQMGGVPSHMSLYQKGFKEVFRIQDAFEMVTKPDPTNPVFSMPSVNGRCALEKWIEDNWETCLRMTSVDMRIAKFIKEHEDEALDIHIPFLNSVSGMELTKETGKMIYHTLDPFQTEEDLENVLLNTSSPFNYWYNVQAIVNVFVGQGVIKPGQFTGEQLLKPAVTLFAQLKSCKIQAKSEIPNAEKAIDEAKAVGADVSEAMDLLSKAKYFYDEALDYYDAVRFAIGAKQFAEYLKSL